MRIRQLPAPAIPVSSELLELLPIPGTNAGCRKTGFQWFQHGANGRAIGASRLSAGLALKSMAK